MKDTHNSKKTVTIQPLSLRSIIRRIVLDIDETLTNAYDDKEEIELKKTSYYQESIDRGLLIDAYYPHILHHGAIEFIQWLFSLPNIEIAFFSAGQADRNIAFVDSLLKKVLGDKLELLNKKVLIFSANELDIEKTKSKHTNDGVHFFKHYNCQYTKNLAKIFDTANLDNVILVDENPGYIAAGQLRNVLLTPGAVMTSYTLLSDATSQMMNSPESAILQANHLFYVTGVLATILETQTDCLANNLFNLQYKLTRDGKYTRNEDLDDNHQYYLKGLAILQKINPKLEFYGGNIALEYLQSNKMSYAM